MIKKDLNEQTSNEYYYDSYTMKLKDRIIAGMIGFLAACIVMHIFFGNIIVDIVIGAGTAVIAQKIYRNFMINRIKNRLTLQFKDMLDSLNSSVSAGNVMSKAFIEAEKDMRLQYGTNSEICRELAIINNGVLNGLTIEELVGDFGKRSGIDDIKSFANVFLMSNRRGGNMKTIISESKSIICDKIEIEQELRAMSSATKNELNIMMLMPLVVVPLISGFVQDSGNDLINILVKIVGIIMFVIAYILGRKITNIKL